MSVFVLLAQPLVDLAKVLLRHRGHGPHDRCHCFCSGRLETDLGLRSSLVSAVLFVIESA